MARISKVAKMSTSRAVCKHTNANIQAKQRANLLLEEKIALGIIKLDIPEEDAEEEEEMSTPPPKKFSALRMRASNDNTTIA